MHIRAPRFPPEFPYAFAHTFMHDQSIDGVYAPAARDEAALGRGHQGTWESVRVCECVCGLQGMDVSIRIFCLSAWTTYHPQ